MRYGAVKTKVIKNGLFAKFALDYLAGHAIPLL